MSAHQDFVSYGERDYSADRSQRYRARRPDAPRHRSKSPSKPRNPSGIRQRRNKHWNW